MIYTVTLNPAVDYVMHVEGSALGGVMRSDNEQCYAGGKGINVSLVLKELGIDSAALGFIAGFTGEFIGNEVRAAGIDEKFIRLKNGITRINVKIKADDESEINGSGPDITQEDIDKLLLQLAGLTKGDIAVFSGSVPKTVGHEGFLRLLAAAGENGGEIVVDCSGEALLASLEHRPFLIKPNHHELAEIFKTVPKNTGEIFALAENLQTMGARNVIVSMAGDGAVLLDEAGGRHHVPAPKGRVLNSVGAGDSMVAGFIAGYTATGDASYALKLGTAAGSATAFSSGLADRKKIDEVLDQL